MHAALMLPHQLVEAAGRDLLSFTRNSRIQSCGQRRLHFVPLVLSILTNLRAPGLQPSIKMIQALAVGLCSQLLRCRPQQRDRGRAGRRSGNRTAPSHYGWRAQTLVCSATPRLSCSWSAVAARPLPLESAVRSFVGCAGGAFAIRPPPGAAAWSDRSSSFRCASLERLAASHIRPSSLCCCCRFGWLAAPALHYAKNRKSADLGIYPGSDRARVCHPLLGRAARAAAACSAIRVSQVPNRLALLTRATTPVPRDKPASLVEAVAASLGAPEF